MTNSHKHNVALAALIGVITGTLIGASTMYTAHTLALLYPNAAKYMTEGYDTRPNTVDSIVTKRVLHDVDVVDRYLKPLPPRVSTLKEKVESRRGERAMRNQYGIELYGTECDAYARGTPRWSKCHLSVGIFTNPDDDPRRFSTLKRSNRNTDQ